MNMSCDDCGYKFNDVKMGGEVFEKGKKVIIKIKIFVDFVCDIFKSESCQFECFEFSFFVNLGIFGGRFIIVEGFFIQVCDDFYK